MAQHQKKSEIKISPIHLSPIHLIDWQVGTTMVKMDKLSHSHLSNIYYQRLILIDIKKRNNRTWSLHDLKFVKNLRDYIMIKFKHLTPYQPRDTDEAKMLIANGYKSDDNCIWLDNKKIGDFTMVGKPTGVLDLPIELPLGWTKDFNKYSLITGFLVSPDGLKKAIDDLTSNNTLDKEYIYVNDNNQVVANVYRFLAAKTLDLAFRVTKFTHSKSDTAEQKVDFNADPKQVLRLTGGTSNHIATNSFSQNLGLPLLRSEKSVVNTAINAVVSPEEEVEKTPLQEIKKIADDLWVELSLNLNIGTDIKLKDNSMRIIMGKLVAAWSLKR